VADETLHLENFSPVARGIIANAQRDADEGSFRETTLAHLALVLLQNGDARGCAQRAGWSVEARRSELAARRGEAGSREPSYLSFTALRLLQRLGKMSSPASVRDLFFALVDEGVLPPTRPESWPPQAPPAAQPLHPATRLALDVERALRPAVQVAASRVLHRFHRNLHAAVVPQLDVETLPPDGLRFGRVGIDDWVAAQPDEQGLVIAIYHGESPRRRRFVLEAASQLFLEDTSGAAFADALCDEIRAALYPELRPGGS